MTELNFLYFRNIYQICDRNWTHEPFSLCCVAGSASCFVLCSGGALGNVVLIPRVLKGWVVERGGPPHWVTFNPTMGLSPRYPCSFICTSLLPHSFPFYCLPTFGLTILVFLWQLSGRVQIRLQSYGCSCRCNVVMKTEFFEDSYTFNHC